MRPPRALLAFSLLLVLLVLVPSQLPAVTGAAVPPKCSSQSEDAKKRVNEAPIVLLATVQSLIQSGVKIIVEKKYKGEKDMKKVEINDGGKSYANLDLHCTLKINSQYVVFVKSVDRRRAVLFAHGPPLPATKQNLNAVKKATSKKKLLEIKGLSNKQVEPKKRLKLQCKVTGKSKSFPDNFSWFKDGIIISKSDKRIKIKNKKRETQLVIKSVQLKDVGEYKCKADFPDRESISKSANITVESSSSNVNSTGSSNNVNSTGSSNNVKSTGSSNNVNSTDSSNNVNSTGSSSNVNSTSSSNNEQNLSVLRYLRNRTFEDIDNEVECDESIKKDFCTNGRCKIIPSINEIYCECFDGFRGDRCLKKDVNSDVPGESLGIDVSTRTLSKYWGKK